MGSFFPNESLARGVNDCKINETKTEQKPDGTIIFILYAPTPHNSQKHSKNSLAKTDELFNCVWPFPGADA